MATRSPITTLMHQVVGSDLQPLYPETVDTVIHNSKYHNSSYQTSNPRIYNNETFDALILAMDSAISTVSGVNDGTVWTKITINGVQMNIPAPASGTVTSVNNISPVSGNVTIYGTNINRSSSNSQTVDAGITQAKDRADEAYSLAQGRSRAFVYADVAATWTAISTQATYSQYRTGDNIFITATGVPDMWYIGLNYSGTSTTINSQATLQAWLEDTTATVGCVSIQAGFFYYSKLESQKVSVGVQSVSGDGGAISTSGTTNVTVSHSTSDGYKHVPANGTSHNGHILVAGSSAGSYSWTSPSNIKAGDASHADSSDEAAFLSTGRDLTMVVQSGLKSDGSTTISSGNVTQNFDGSAAKTWTINLGDSGIGAGTYSAITFNAKGIAIQGKQILYVGSIQPANLISGGIWFKTT